MRVETILWRRLDGPGHDACRLTQTDHGYRLDGTSVFHHNGTPAQFRYRVLCDREWRTRRGLVNGWLGTASVAFSTRRTPEGVWTLNGVVVPGLQECVDVDFAFTPATNLSQIRRIALTVGQSADVPVAWLDVPAGTLGILRQRYERRTDTTYSYQAPLLDFTTLLHVRAPGFIERYPPLWEAES